VLWRSERFILVFAFLEKHVRRAFVHMAEHKGGLTNEDALAASKDATGMHKLNAHWKTYDPKKRTLTKMLGNHWKTIHRCVELRNQLIHGPGHKDQRMYKEEIPKLFEVLEEARSIFSKEYGLQVGSISENNQTACFEQ
jgi:hypothetical protein